MRKPLFYISSTFRDLCQYRQATIEAIRKLGFDYEAMEQYTAEEELPVSKCINDVSSADFYIGILAWRYGFVPNGYDRSITHLEYETASRWGIPQLMFVVSQTHPWNPEQIDRGTQGELVEAFKKEVLAHHQVEFFTTVEDLRVKVTSAATVAVFRRLSDSQYLEKGSPLDRYRSVLRARCSHVRLIGVTSTPVLVPLSQLFVEPRLQLSSVSALETRDRTDPANDQMVLSEIFGVALPGTLSYILGQPGSGKSTLLRYLAHLLLNGRNDELFLKHSLTPFLCHASRVSQRADSPAQMFFRMLPDAEGANLTQRGFENVINSNRCVFLIDGLDEITDASVRAQVNHHITEFSNQHRESIVIATMRSKAFQTFGDESVSRLVITVSAFDKARGNEFVDCWFRTAAYALEMSPEAVMTLKNPEELARSVKDFWIHSSLIGLESRRNLLSPFVLNLLCIAALRGLGRLKTIADVYEQGLHCIFFDWHRTSHETAASVYTYAEAVFRQIAFKEHLKGTRDTIQRNDIDRTILDITRGYAAGRYLDSTSFLLWAVNDVGLLEETGPDQYGFSHLGLQEFFTAKYLVEHAETHLPLLVQRIRDPWWYEVIVHVLSFRVTDVTERFMLLALTEEHLVEDEAVLRELITVSLFDPTPLLTMFSRSDTILPAAREAAERLMQQTALHVLSSRSVENLIPTVTSEQLRQDTPDVVVMNISQTVSIRFRKIPDGMCIMGSNNESHPEEHPEHRVFLTSFWLAETPTTNEQYALFLSDTGYREPAFWGESRMANRHYPVVGVSWYDANAYAKWLSLKSTCDCRLPTEAQWEYAARGNDGRVYPWGNELPTPDLACYSGEAMKQHPDMVGTHPRGAGPFGCLDQAGNVFEWCLDIWNPAAYKRRGHTLSRNPISVSGDSSQRALRGGTWWFTADGLRASYRWKNPAVNTNDDIGFRLVLCNPSELGDSSSTSKVIIELE